MNASNQNTVFTTSHLDTLRAEFATIERIDPSAPAFAKLTALLDSLDKKQLQQFADACIKFVSLLAANRLRRGERIDAALHNASAHDEGRQQG